MANIVANPQVPEYSLSKVIGWLFFLLLFLPLTLSAQQGSLSTSSKKAAELYAKANNYLKARNFDKAIEALNAAKAKDSTFGEAYLKLGGLYKVLGNKEAAYQHYRHGLRLLPYSPALGTEYYNFGDMSLAAGHYGVARENFERYLKNAPKNSKAANYAQAQLNNIAFAEKAMQNPVAFNPVRLGDPLNRFDLQYFPALTADRRHILFTGLNRPQNDENLYVSVQQGQGWSEPISISPNINTRFNEGAGSISGDGKTLVFAACDRPDSFGSCDLYISYRTGEQWSKPVNLGATVNSGTWDSQPSLSADGRTLYFSSERSGGIGGADIWVTTLDEGNNWQEPRNLGKSINTTRKENSPFIHPSGSTLYFASDGHLGMGGSDIFKASLDEKGNWTLPQNLGYPLNTFENENSIFISTDNKIGYYSRQQTAKEGSYRFELYQFAVPDRWKSKVQSTYAQGTVFDAETKKPLGAVVQLYDVSTDKLVQQVQSDPINGNYTIVLTEGRQYAMYVSANGYLLKSLAFDYSNRQDFNPLALDVYLDPLRPGANIVLNNLFFPSNQYALEPRSKTELNKLVQFLTGNPKVRIQISGHTDDVGDNASNLNLSKKRAQSVVDYLTQKGINRTRLVAAGFGETQPVKANTSEEHRQLNRRIELKLL